MSIPKEKIVSKSVPTPVDHKNDNERIADGLISLGYDPQLAAKIGENLSRIRGAYTPIKSDGSECRFDLQLSITKDADKATVIFKPPTDTMPVYVFVDRSAPILGPISINSPIVGCKPWTGLSDQDVVDLSTAAGSVLRLSRDTRHFDRPLTFEMVLK